MTNRSQLLISLFLVVAALLTLVLLGWFLGSAVAFLAVFPWLVSSLTSAGVHPHLARALALPAAAAAVWAISQALSLNRTKRRVGLLVFIAVYCLWASAMWRMTRDYNFDPVTGVSLRKYAETPYGYEEVPASWNVHPTFGTKAQPMTTQIATAIDLQKQFGSFVSPGDALFAPDGTALAWYCETPEDGIELFRTPGHHPRKNIPLLPVTSEIARRIVKGNAATADATPESLKLEGLHRLRMHLEHAEEATR